MSIAFIPEWMEKVATFSLRELLTNPDTSHLDEVALLQFFLNTAPSASAILSSEIIKNFTRQLQIPFEASEAIENSSPVCFAQSHEVRNDYFPKPLPTVFYTKNILEYVVGILYSRSNTAITIPYPTHQHHFWEMVDAGQQYLKQHFSQP